MSLLIFRLINIKILYRKYFIRVIAFYDFGFIYLFIWIYLTIKKGVYFAYCTVFPGLIFCGVKNFNTTGYTNPYIELSLLGEAEILDLLNTGYILVNTQTLY